MSTLSMEVTSRLRSLEALLSSLPTSIPYGQNHYQFSGYTPSQEDVELYGTEAAALNRTLEVTFCPGGRKPNEPIPLKERGQGLVAVVFALEKQLTRHPEESALLLKWVDDLSEAAKSAGGNQAAPVSQEHYEEVVLTNNDGCRNRIHAMCRLPRPVHRS